MVTQETELVVDAHVHFYKCFDPYTFLNSAFNNMSKVTSSSKRSQDSVKVLLLTESSTEDAFLRLSRASENLSQPAIRGREDWYVCQTGDTGALLLKNNFGKSLYFLAGRQLVCREGLEVHALATDTVIDDGQPLLETIDAIFSCGGIAAMPWGAGKWLGKRGKILTSLSEQFLKKGVLLSDSGIRPWIWPRPGLFSKDYCVIAGTDPLPLSVEAGRVGSYGFSTIASWDPERPVHSLRALLKIRQLDLSHFGRRQGLLPFLSRQYLIRR